MSSSSKSEIQGDIRSDALPGGTLIRALLDRRLMGLADMGGSSGQIGARWSDIVSDRMDALVGTEIGIPGGGSHVIEQIVRLDSKPQVARAASKRSLQKPDFVFLGRANGQLTMQAADAKFSIETARSKQVSVEMLTALAEVGPEYTDLIGSWSGAGTIVPGLFFAPQSALSTYVLSGGRGIMRATVDRDEVELLGSTGAELTEPIPGGAVRQRLAILDRLDTRLDRELLCGVYYTRLSSAIGASWFDMHRPLLGPSTLSGPDFAVVEQEVEDRIVDKCTAWELVNDWAQDAETVRANRAAIQQAAALPLPNRELREWVVADAKAANLQAPSLNRVRKTLQRWVQDRILDETGVIQPDQNHTERYVARIRKIVGDLAPSARTEVTGIVHQLGEPLELPSGG